MITTDSFRVSLTLGGQQEPACTWSDFAAANADSFAPEEIEHMRRKILAGKIVTGGGGAAPVYEIRLAT